MKSLLFLRDSSIFKKMLVAFLAALLPLLAITWMIVEQGSNRIRGEISESVLNTARYYMDSLDKEADRIERYLPNYVMDQDLMEIAATGDHMSSYERSSSILDIQKRLDLMRNSSPFIRETKAYIPVIDRTVLSHSFETFLDLEEYAAMRQSGKLYEEPFIIWRDRLFMSMQYPTGTSSKPLYIVAVELSVPEIRGTLAQIRGSRGGGSAMINLDRGWSVESGADADMASHMQEFSRQKSAAGARQGSETIAYNGARYVAIYTYSAVWNAYAVTYVPEAEVLGSLEVYRTLFWWACGLAVVIVLFFTYFLLRIIYRPLMKLVHSFRRVQMNRLETIAVDRGADEFGYLYEAFNDTVLHLKTLIEENYEGQIRNQRSELKRLQSQINPHFLYNCFFVLCRLIKSGNQQEKAYRFCLHIGQYFQFITRNDEDDIPLKLEAEHSRTYVEMQSICYGDRIQVAFDGQDRLPDILVPRLILQPVIENAYKHAFDRMPGPGELWLRGEPDEGSFVFYVEDNGDRITDEEIEALRKKLRYSANRIEETTGLLNVHRRIQLRYGEEYGLAVARSELGGLQVRIRLSAG
ncbi:sensor histidine kinase [Paenibacillus sp. MY03]|uniref:sensor histidine kinase n=1 Tax=Paenibacillus sp. MY03 TaxID=302980 RepID=UPI000B3CC888|nr:histidine kinase [Paenibacillus sp. MY03]OUS77131.1 sensor histidine kinase [Paenibacillus sp. MY03]